MSRNGWIFAAVLSMLSHVARADEAKPDAGTAPVCTPHANPKPQQALLVQALDAAGPITADYLENSPAAMPDKVPGMLRQMAAVIECDKAATTDWPTQQECFAMPTFCAVGRPIADCRKEADARTACLEKARREDPRVTADRLANKARAEADRIDALIAAELACRGSAKCLDRRAAKIACYNIQRKRDLLESIAQEKANPAGVVDLVRLHDLGEGVQNAEADFKAAAADYQAKQHKPFRESVCR